MSLMVNFPQGQWQGGINQCRQWTRKVKAEESFGFNLVQVTGSQPGVNLPLGWHLAMFEDSFVLMTWEEGRQCYQHLVLDVRGAAEPPTMHGTVPTHKLSGPKSKQRGLPRGLSALEATCQCRRHGLDPWVGKIPWRRKWQPTSVFLPGKAHGQRRLVGCSLWGHKELDRTEELSMHTKINSTMV